jgi:hypothetical protein
LPHRRRGGRVMHPRLYVCAVGVGLVLTVLAILSGALRKAHGAVPAEEA